jgi:small subunit ribosomal protein S13
MNKMPFKDKLLETFGINEKKVKYLFNYSGLNNRIPISGLKIRQFGEINKNLRKIKTGKKLKEDIRTTILFLSRIKNYKGIRHKLKYPVRGQRTHTNAKTNKKIKF